MNLTIFESLKLKVPQLSESMPVDIYISDIDSNKKDKREKATQFARSQKEKVLELVNTEYETLKSVSDEDLILNVSAFLHWLPVTKLDDYNTSIKKLNAHHLIIHTILSVDPLFGRMITIKQNTPEMIEETGKKVRAMLYEKQ